jgi:hypothetical protein
MDSGAFHFLPSLLGEIAARIFQDAVQIYPANSPDFLSRSVEVKSRDVQICTILRGQTPDEKRPDLREHKSGRVARTFRD